MFITGPASHPRTLPSSDRELWWRQSSFKGKEITTEAQAEGAIEGAGDDYKVADFFSTDFKYRRFGIAEAAPRNISTLSGAKRIGQGSTWNTSRAGTLGDDMAGIDRRRE